VKLVKRIDLKDLSRLKCIGYASLAFLSTVGFDLFSNITALKHISYMVHDPLYSQKIASSILLAVSNVFSVFADANLVTSIFFSCVAALPKKAKAPQASLQNPWVK